MASPRGFRSKTYRAVRNTGGSRVWNYKTSFRSYARNTNIVKEFPLPNDYSVKIIYQIESTAILIDLHDIVSKQSKFVLIINVNTLDLRGQIWCVD